MTPISVYKRGLALSYATAAVFFSVFFLSFPWTMYGNFHDLLRDNYALLWFIGACTCVYMLLFATSVYFVVMFRKGVVFYQDNGFIKFNLPFASPISISDIRHVEAVNSPIGVGKICLSMSDGSRKYISPGLLADSGFQLIKKIEALLIR